MVLSNRKRQERHRATRRSRASLLDRLVEGWTARRADLDQQLELLETGVMRTGTNNVDDTAKSIARVRQYIADYDQLVAEYGKTEIPLRHWLIQPVPGALGMFSATEQPTTVNSRTVAGTREQVENALRFFDCSASEIDTDVWFQEKHPR